MRDSDKWAVIYTTLALIFVVAGYIKQIEGFLYVAILLTIVSFYWMFREQIIKKFRRK